MILLLLFVNWLLCVKETIWKSLKYLNWCPTLNILFQIKATVACRKTYTSPRVRTDSNWVAIKLNGFNAKILNEYQALTRITGNARRFAIKEVLENVWMTFVFLVDLVYIYVTSIAGCCCWWKEWIQIEIDLTNCVLQFKLFV